MASKDLRPYRPRKSRKNKSSMVGAALLVVMIIASLLAYRVTHYSIAAFMTASLLTYPIPYYYLRRLRPYRAVAASIISTMLSGTLTALVLYFYSGFSTKAMPDPNIVEVSLFTVASIFSAGIVGVLGASLAWAHLLTLVINARSSLFSDVFSSALAGVALSVYSVLGIIIYRSIRRRSALNSFSVLIITILATLSYLSYLILSLGYINYIIK